MKKLIFYFIMLSFVAACTDKFDEFNTDTKNPSAVTPGSLFAGAERQLADAMTNSNQNLNIFRLLAQQWTQTTYIDESNYDLATRNIPQNFWNIIYLDVLKALDEAQKLIPDQNPAVVSEATKKNQNACAEILIVYAYSTMVKTFGNIPYKDALDPDKVYPVYDDAAGIYTDLIARLDAALTAINSGEEGFGSNDILLGGQMNHWLIFGNSLKLRMGMELADVDAGKAKSIVESAASKAISSNDDNVAFHYLSAPPNTNPIWVDLVQSGRKDFVAANTLVDVMTGLSDPRIPLFFTQDAQGGYTGGIYGSNNNYATYSKPSETITDPSFEALLLDYSEVEFLKAEAVERGFAVGGSAEEHYNNGIRASISYWGGSDAQANTYLSDGKVAYSTATGNWKQKIGTQKWIALYNRGFESWTEIRRLDFPQLQLPSDAVTGYPNRYTYPVQEQNLNTQNYNQAASAIGGDKVETKLFWDKF